MDIRSANLGMVVKFNRKKKENLQFNILRTILNAPWFVKNDDNKKTLKIL